MALETGRRTYQMIALIASSLGLFVACGIGPSPHSSPVPPPGISPIRTSAEGLYFGAIATLSSSTQQEVTLSNDSDDPVAIGWISLSERDSFSKTTNCGHQIAAHATCSVQVIFNPQTAGAFNAFMTVSLPRFAYLRVELHGTSIAPPTPSPLIP
jgi:hypothetical protein